MITSQEMQKERKKYIEEIADKMARKSYKVLEDTIENGVQQFLLNGKIKTTKRYISVQYEVLDKEMKIPKDCNVNILASKVAMDKIKSMLEENGWILHNGYLLPLDKIKEDD